MRKVNSLGKDWCWEGLRAGRERDNRGWDGWMASPTQWTWVWVNSGSWWWTGRPGILKFMGSQSRTRLSDWTELNWNSTLTGDWTFHMGYQKPLFLSKFLEVDPTLHFRSFKKTLFFPKVYSKREIWKRKGNIVHNVVSSWKKLGMILHRDQHSNCD